MPPKSKKKNKKKKISPEDIRRERIKALQAEAIRETGYVAGNIRKINRRWTSVLRELKIQEIREDLESAWHNFEKVIDIKNYLIDHLAQQLDESEIQVEMNIQSHIEGLSVMIDLFKEFLTEQQVSYDKERDRLVKEWQEELKMIENTNEEDSVRLGTIMFGTGRKWDDSEVEQIAEYMTKSDDIMSKDLEDRQKFRVHLELAIDSNWQAFHHVLREYQESTEERRKLYMDLKERDVRNSNIIYLHLRKIQSLQELKRLAEKGEMVVRRAEMCRKLETESEKVVPFYNSSLDEDEEEFIETKLKQPPLIELTRVMKEYAALENFWKRFNKAFLDRGALKMHHEILMQENNRLQAALRRYLRGPTIEDPECKDTLLMVNQIVCNVSALHDARVKRKSLRVPVVEASLELKRILD